MYILCGGIKFFFQHTFSHKGEIGTEVMYIQNSGLSFSFQNGRV